MLRFRPAFIESPRSVAVDSTCGDVAERRIGRAAVDARRVDVAAAEAIRAARCGCSSRSRRASASTAGVSADETERPLRHHQIRRPACTCSADSTSWSAPPSNGFGIARD